ncbi:MAG TPA: hypothetical protein VEZ16_07150 [Microvirga sp.]|nr:hypothetical protein [Microvirga sp.]
MGMMRRSRIAVQALEKASQSGLGKIELTRRYALAIDRRIDRLPVGPQQIDVVLPEGAVQPDADIVVDPLPVRRLLGQFPYAVVPDGDHLLLLGQFADDGSDMPLRRPKLAFDGEVVALPHRPEKGESRKSKACRRYGSHRKNDPGPERAAGIQWVRSGHVSDPAGQVARMMDRSS